MATVDINFDYGTVDVKDEVIGALKINLPKFGFGKVKVLGSDPQSPSELPCVGINRANDDEANMSIADHHGDDYDGTSGTYVTQQGTFFSESVEIRVWHTNADERDKLYKVVKAILFTYRLAWVEKGLLNVSLRGGRDEQDSSMTNAPTVIYWSVITMVYLNPLNVEITESVEGITDFTVNTALTVDIET